MKTQEIIDRAENVLMHTYGRYQIVLDKGQGVYLYDNDGKEYLDFASGIGVFALGYNNTEYVEAVTGQLKKLTHTSNYYYNEPSLKAAESFCKASQMDRVFFTNSGTEAVEGAVKLARKYYYEKTGNADSEIIAFDHSFHGRSMGALSVTGTKKYRDPFEPLIGGVKFASYNDLDSVKALVSDKTCAIIMETIQGEGGIHPSTPEFIRGIRKLCDEKDILLILDEVQCGMGRSGRMFAYQAYNILPDIMTSAKGLGSGVPVGAFAARGKCAESLKPGDHGSTYGGNPLCTAASAKVFDMFERHQILDNVNNVGEYLYDKLEEVKNMFPDKIKDHRGMKMMQGLEFTFEVKDLVKALMAEGLITIAAGACVIRFLPPLVITEAHVDEMIEILKKTLQD